MSFLHLLRRSAALALAALVLAACGDGATPPPAPLVVSAAGTLQRGAIVTLSATREGRAVPAGDVSWTVSPAASGEVLAGGQLRLLAAGTLTVQGSYDGSTGSATLQVVEPPPPPPGALSITATGALEQGRTVQLAVTRDGQAVPAGSVTWTLVPADGGEILPGGQLRLLAAGVLEVRGAYDGSTGSAQLHVAAPQPLAITVAGRVERGSVITATATRGGEAVPAAQVTWTVTPAAAGEVLPGGQIRLLAAGAVQVAASYDLSTGTLPVTVAVPPSVVFDMQVNGNRDLYRVALDGGDLVRLTDAPAEEREATVGGDRIVFVSFRSGNADLYSVPLAGGAETRLTSTARAETAPALSANGQRLAYAYDVSGVSRIWTANANGTGAAAITAGLGSAASPETGPTWAPDGSRLAFVTTARGSADVWELVPGGTPVAVAEGDSAEVDPAWSPDGTRVAFASTRQGDAAVYVVRLDDRANAVRLTTRAGTEAEPAWTADGRLVYVEFSPGSVTRMVWIDLADPATVHVIPLTGNPRRPAVIR